MRRFVREVINALGYDLHKLEKDCSPAFASEETLICEVTGGAKFLVFNPRDAIQKSHVEGRYYEAEILERISKEFPEGGVFVDIGANVGNHTIFVACNLSPKKVIALEPMRLQHSALVVNVLLNNLQDTVSIWKVAASESFGMARMVNPHKNNTGKSRLSDYPAGEWVETRVGDEIVAGEVIDFIKIDVEGHEIEVLGGLQKTIEGCRPKILIEVDNVNLSRFKEWMEINDYVETFSLKQYRPNQDFLIVPK